MPDSAPEDPTPRAADSSKKRTFARRLLSTLILWASFGTAFYLAWQWLFVSLLAVIALAALLEYFHLFQEDRHRRFRSQTVLVATLYLGILAARAAGLCPDWLASFDGGALAALVILIVASGCAGRWRVFGRSRKSRSPFSASFISSSSSRSPEKPSSSILKTPPARPAPLISMCSTC